MEKEKRSHKGDIVLVSVILLLAVIFWLVFTFLIKKEGLKVLVKVDGEVKYEYLLTDDIETTVEGYKGGSNKLIIKDKIAYLIEADCPDKLCVKSGSISKVAETIVCLPHRVVVEISGDTK